MRSLVIVVSLLLLAPSAAQAKPPKKSDCKIHADNIKALSSQLGLRPGIRGGALMAAVEDWIDKSGKFWKYVKRLAEAGVLYYSPGSAPQLVDRKADGELKTFMIVEDTMTVFPAQVNLRPLAEVKAAFTAAGSSSLLPPTVRPRS